MIASRTGARLLAAAALAAMTSGCGKSSSERPTLKEQREEAERAPPPPPSASAAMPLRVPKGAGGAGAMARAKKPVGALDEFGEGGVSGLGGIAGAAAEPSGMVPGGSPEPAESGGGGTPAATRAWFPETFLFEPRVVTDEAGAATVQVRVPDRLTTWRILALAHSRDGAQAGTEASFLGTLPVYVDLVVPHFLIAGDEVRLPVQIVNTTDEDIMRTLRVEAAGAALGRGQGPTRIAKGSIKVEYVPLRANRAGTVTVRASLEDKDAVERTITVLPAGRPVTENRGGTLAAPRTIELAVPKNAQSDSGSARLLVFPGALAILRSELGAAPARAGTAADAYALLLAGRGEGLIRALGGEPDEKALRTLGIVAGQRVIRAARSPDPVTASLLIESAIAHPGNPVLARLGERLAETVVRVQRPDGTFYGVSGWTLQRLLVTSADLLRAVLAATASPSGRQRAQRAHLRAEGAFERNIERVEDAYTAAAIVASGGVKGTLRDRLRKRVRDAVRQNPDGSRSLPVEPGVVGHDGQPPSEIEATALAVLALADDPEAAAIRPDLGARLLASYEPSRGWGDGATNLAAIRAVLALFKDPLPPKVTVSAEIDGRPFGQGVLEGARLREVLALDGPLPAAPGKHQLTVRADPPVPGLGFSLTWKVFLPWAPAPQLERGLELAVDPKKEGQVGKPVELTLSASAPAGMGFVIRHAVPAGVQVDRPSLDALVADQTIVSYRSEDGTTEIHVAAREPGQTFQARYRAIPTLAGTFSSGASSIAIEGQPRARAASGVDPGAPFFVPPARWVVK